MVLVEDVPCCCAGGGAVFPAPLEALFAGRPNRRHRLGGRRRLRGGRWVMLRQDGIASHDPRAIVAIEPHQSAVTQAKHPARGLHSSRSQAHRDIVVAQLTKPLKDSRRGAEVQARLRGCVTGAAGGTTSAAGHGEARARRYAKSFQEPLSDQQLRVHLLLSLVHVTPCNKLHYTKSSAHTVPQDKLIEASTVRVQVSHQCDHIPRCELRAADGARLPGSTSSPAESPFLRSRRLLVQCLCT